MFIIKNYKYPNTNKTIVNFISPAAEFFGKNNRKICSQFFPFLITIDLNQSVMVTFTNFSWLKSMRLKLSWILRLAKK
jgi:hypothetical protein